PFSLGIQILLAVLDMDFSLIISCVYRFSQLSKSLSAYASAAIFTQSLLNHVNHKISKMPLRIQDTTIVLGTGVLSTTKVMILSPRSAIPAKAKPVPNGRIPQRLRLNP